MKRSKFSLSNYKLLTCDMGQLVPCGLTEVLPGDTFQGTTNLLVRVSPMIAPVMHPVDVRIHHWFVPHRLVWQDFENFITGGPDGNNASVFPTIDSGAGFAIGSLADYFGIATGVASRAVSALPFRGYSLIWNEFYRDQDLQTPLTISRASGLDTTTNTALQLGSWQKDRFTMSRPSPQKGAAVGLPLGTTAPIKYTAVDSPAAELSVLNAAGNYRTLTSSTTYLSTTTNAGIAGNALVADLTTATAATISQLREAFAIQRYRENRMRYGSRYVEYLASSFGVRSSDGRLDRPEYLAGGSNTLQFSEVLQTARNDAATTGVGQLSGHGIGGARSNRFRKFFEEHGYMFTFMQVLPRTMYMQGIPATFNKRVKEEFYQHELAHLGSAPIPNKEIFAASAQPDGTFGFQDRYDEYRHALNTVSGEFRTTLDYWHLARSFGSAPALNASFVQANVTKRINQVSVANSLWVMCSHSLQARRCVSASGTPLGV